MSGLQIEGALSANALDPDVTVRGAPVSGLETAVVCSEHVRDSRDSAGCRLDGELSQAAVAVAPG